MVLDSTMGERTSAEVAEARTSGARASGRRFSAELTKDLLAAGAGSIVDPEGNGYDPIGSTQGERPGFRASLTEIGDNVKEKLGSVIGENALDPQVAEQLRSNNPQTAAFLSSTSGAVVEAAVFSTYVVLDMGKGLYSSKVMHGEFAKEHTVIYSSLLITQGFIQIALGLSSAVYFEGSAGLRRLLDANRFMKFSVVSVLFALAQNFSVLAYSIFLPGTIKILGQCRLLNTAILSKIIFNRRYSETQWLLMLIIMLGAVLFLFAKQQNDDLFDYRTDIEDEQMGLDACFSLLNSTLGSSGYIINRTYDGLQPVPTVCVDKPDEPVVDDEDSYWLGIFYVFAYIMCSDIASIVSEMFLKSEKDTPYYIQKVTMEAMGIPVLLLTSFTTPYLQMVLGVKSKRWAPQMWWAADDWRGFMGGAEAVKWCSEDAKYLSYHPDGLCCAAAGGLWQSWMGNFAPWGALFFSSSQSWFAGILVKLLSSVVKLLAKVVSLGGVFFVGDLWLLRSPGDAPVSTCATFAAIQVIMLTYSFLTIKTPKDEIPKRAAHQQEPEQHLGSVELQPYAQPDAQTQEEAQVAAHQQQPEQHLGAVELQPYAQPDAQTQEEAQVAAAPLGP